jgi:hypothetical protein
MQVNAGKGKWEQLSIPLVAAASGSIEVVERLWQQEGIVIDSRVLVAAAACNQIGVASICAVQAVNSQIRHVNKLLHMAT